MMFPSFKNLLFES
ncbi:hypothetical protein LINPERPRIM_LOCUS2097 [Linum perenne]